MKRLSFKSITLMCCMALSFGACQDIVTYNDNYDDEMASSGAPVIDAVYDSKDRDKLLPITDGNLEQMIVLDGSNLSRVRKVMFNDVELPVGEVYATAGSAYLPIPRQIPLEVNNKLYYETELGSTTYDFTVSVPLVQVDGLYNEFALPGTSVQLKGKYFDLYGFGGANSTSTVKMNGVELEVDSISDKYMSVVIPEDAQDNSVIEVSYMGAGSVAHTEKIPYRMTDAIIWNLSHMVMEASSQALKYERVGNTHFDTAIFLNISKDHISPTEHKDFDDYFQSKLKIFDRCTCACVNLDSDHIGEILKAAAKCERVVTFGSKENAVIRVSDIKPGRGKFYFHVAGPDFSEDFTLPVHGAFNVENAVEIGRASCRERV